MADWFYVLFMVLFPVTSVGVKLTVTPRTVTAGEERPVTIKCEAGNLLRQVQGFSLVVVKHGVAQDVRILASATVFDNNGKALLKDTSLATRASVTGKIDNSDKSATFVQIELSKLYCNDSKNFVCEITFIKPDSTNAVSEDRLDITILSKPDNIEMRVIPWHSDDSYHVNETVEFVCSGNVGNPPPSKPWSWQWKSPATNSTWLSYPYPDRLNEYTYEGSGLTSCEHRRGSTLRHVVKRDDDGRIFRCLVNNSEVYSDRVTIYVRDLLTPSIHESKAMKAESTLTSSMFIALVVVAVISSFLLIVVTVLFICYSRSQRKNRAIAGATEEKGGKYEAVESNDCYQPDNSTNESV